MPTLQVVTTFPENRWDIYAKRMLQSHIDFWPDDVKITAYHEGQTPDLIHPKIEYVNIEEANPELVKFKTRHKNDPVANGEIEEIKGGVRRLPEAGNNDKGKGSYLWDAVRFAHKTFAVDHAIKNIDVDYILWLDADTYTFRNIPKDFVTNLLPFDKVLIYLGRGEKYPECGWVSYNRRHYLINTFIETWTNLYKNDTLFKHLEWHDSYVFWHLTKEYRQQHSAKVHDIGYSKGVRGHHVFVNSELGQYIDHFKGDRKETQRSTADDIRKTPELSNVDYWKDVK